MLLNIPVYLLIICSSSNLSVTPWSLYRLISVAYDVPLFFMFSFTCAELSSLLIICLQFCYYPGERLANKTNQEYQVKQSGQKNQCTYRWLSLNASLFQIMRFMGLFCKHQRKSHINALNLDSIPIDLSQSRWSQLQWAISLHSVCCWRELVVLNQFRSKCYWIVVNQYRFLCWPKILPNNDKY